MPYRSEGEIEKVPDSIRSQALMLATDAERKQQESDRIRNAKLAAKQQQRQAVVTEIVSKINLHPDKVMKVIGKFAKQGLLEVKLSHKKMFKHFLPFWFRVRYFRYREDIATHIAFLLTKNFKLEARTSYISGRNSWGDYWSHSCILISWAKNK